MALPTLPLALVAMSLVALFIFVHLRKRRKYTSIPAISPQWPVVGNALSLDLSRCHMVFADWATKFGPIFRIRLFKEDILVLNDHKSIHDALVAKGSAFAGRPRMYRTSKEDRHHHSIVWQTYTERLQFLRKEVHKGLRMFGSGLDNLELRCIPEMDSLLAQIDSYQGRSFDPRGPIFDAVANVMLGLTLEQSYGSQSPRCQMLKEICGLFNESFGSGQARSMDFLPWLRNVFVRSQSNQLQKALNMRDRFWEREFQELMTKEKTDSIVHKLMFHMNKHHPEEIGNITEKTVKECCTNLLLAGTDTTVTALTCLVLIFLHKPEVQNLMWMEVFDHVGRNRHPALSDMVHMPYCSAVLLELLRYISHIPLAVPHCSICDTDVCGISVPKDMTVYINLWAAHHNPTDWPEPWEFIPERFLDDDGALLPLDHPTRRKLMAFGAGKRACLGETLAKNRLFLFATVLVQRFKFLPSMDDLNQLPSMDPRLFEMGLVLHPSPFKLRASARFSVSRRTSLI